MLTNILVTLDGSPYSEAVLPVVERLVMGSGAAVTIFAVSEPPSATPEGPMSAEPPAVPRGSGLYTRVAVLPRYGETRTQAIERRQRELREYLEGKAEPLRARGISVDVTVALGEDAGRLIIEYARDHPFDLIAMATHGHTGLRSLIFGSVTGKVLGSGVRPLLVVRPRDLGHHPQ